MLARIRDRSVRLPIAGRRDSLDGSDRPIVGHRAEQGEGERGVAPCADPGVRPGRTVRAPRPPTTIAVRNPPRRRPRAETEVRGKPGPTTSRERNEDRSEEVREPETDAKSARKPPAPSKSATPKATLGPRVLTRSEMQKPRSPFLEPPGSEGVVADRYGPGPTDWSEVPPWRQTSFFGIRAQGRFFVYVIDCSESMIEEDRFARATMEVRRSVLALQAAAAVRGHLLQ